MLSLRALRESGLTMALELLRIEGTTSWSFVCWLTLCRGLARISPLFPMWPQASTVKPIKPPLPTKNAPSPGASAT